MDTSYIDDVNFLIDYASQKYTPPTKMEGISEEDKINNRKQVAQYNCFCVASRKICDNQQTDPDDILNDIEIAFLFESLSSKQQINKDYYDYESKVIEDMRAKLQEKRRFEL